MKSIIALLSLTAATHAWQPVDGSMLTVWGAQVTPDTAWREYPRPMMQRKEWTNLNGLWDYAVTPMTQAGNPDKWDGQILVPFAIESALSGVKKPFTPDDALWYRRPLEITPRVGKRYLLNFEAVDYQSTVWANGKEVGSHRGGNLPFSFDVTEALQPGINTLLVRVTDATDTTYQLHGKQLLKPHGIFYTGVSGIWQTVWLEEVPELHVRNLKITPKIDGTVALAIDIEGPSDKPPSVTVTASLGGRKIAETSGSPDRLTLKIPDPKLWSPASPTLYDLSITLGGDTVTSYVGLRETTVGKDADGNLRFHLNGREVFHFGPLDQGWWPDGLLTPPSAAAMCSDLEFLKAAGFNMLRKHIKVEPRRYYHHCDKIGLLVWQDQVSAYGSAAIEKAEGGDGNLSLHVWRAGQVADVTLKLKAFGVVDSATCPYACPKCEALIPVLAEQAKKAPLPPKKPEKGEKWGKEHRTLNVQHRTSKGRAEISSR